VSEYLELVEIKKLIKKKIREDLRKHNEQVAREIIESTWSTKKTKKVLALGQNLLPRIKNKEGVEIFDRDKIVEVASSFFKNLYKDPRDTGGSLDLWHNLVRNHQDYSPFTEREIEKGLSRVKSASALGPDGIGNESLKIYCEALTAPLVALFDAILASGHPLSQWLLSEIILIHKKGYRMDVNNYRPISLASSLMKVFMSLLKNKCYKHLDSHQGP